MEFASHSVEKEWKKRNKIIRLISNANMIDVCKRLRAVAMLFINYDISFFKFLFVFFCRYKI